MTTTTPGPDHQHAPDWVYRSWPGCTCPWAIRPLGELDGISMGRDWVRLSAAPNCLHHGIGPDDVNQN